MFRSTFRITASAIAFIAMLASVGFSADSLTTRIDKAATQIHKSVTDKGESTITIGAFNPPAGHVGSSSTGIQLRLAKALEVNGLAIVEEGARFTLQGNVFDGGGVATIAPVLYDTTTEEVINLDRIPVKDAAAATELLQVTIQHNPNLTPSEQAKRIAMASKNPAGHLDGSLIQSGDGSPLAVEILVASERVISPDRKPDPKNYKPLSAKRDETNRMLYAEIANGQVFAVRLKNKSADEVLASVTIDGINCFQFSDTGSRHWLVAAGNDLVVYGWHIDNKTTEEFKVVDLPDSKVRVHSEAVGVINVQFFKCFPEGQGPRAVGGGETISIPTIQVKRDRGSLLENIAIRYER